MSLYGMDANINQTDGLQQAFANRVSSLSDRNQDILSKWQDGQRTKIEEDTVEQYGDQAIGVGKVIEQGVSAGSTAKNYLDRKKQKVEDKLEQGNRRRRNRKRRIRREAGEDGVSTDEDEGEIKRDDAGQEIQKPRVNKPTNGRTDDPEADGEAQHNTGSAPESPENVATDTHEGESSGGQDDQPEAVQSEPPTDNGETSAPEEPAPAPAPEEPAPVEEAPEEPTQVDTTSGRLDAGRTGIGGEADRFGLEDEPAPVEAPTEAPSAGFVDFGDDDINAIANRLNQSGGVDGRPIVSPEPTQEEPEEPTSAPDPVEPVQPLETRSASSFEDLQYGGESSSLPWADRTVASARAPTETEMGGVRAQVSRARGRLAELEEMPTTIDEHIASQTSEGLSSRLSRLTSSARETVGNAVSRARANFSPAESLEEQRASISAPAEEPASIDDAPVERPTSYSTADDNVDLDDIMRRIRGDDTPTTAPADEPALASLPEDAVADATATADESVSAGRDAIASAGRVAGETGDAVASATGDAVAGATETAGRVGDAVSGATETASSLLDRGSAFVGRVGRGISSATETAGTVARQVGEGDYEGATRTTASAIEEAGADADEAVGVGGKVAQGATKLAGGVLKYGGAVAGLASFGEGLYGEYEAGGKEGDDTLQRTANWASTVSSGLETVGAGLDLSGLGVEAGVALNIAGAVVGAGADIVDDIDKWFEDKKKKKDDQNKLNTQKAQGLEGVQGNPTYQNIGGSGEVAGVSQSAVRVGG